MPRHQVILRKKDVSTSIDAGTSLVELSGIGVACKDHIACTVGDSVVSVCGNIVGELMDIISGGLSGRGLLGADGAESDDYFVVERASVPQ